jgi:hypothetical protein
MESRIEALKVYHPWYYGRIFSSFHNRLYVKPQNDTFHIKTIRPTNWLVDTRIAKVKSVVVDICLARSIFKVITLMGQLDREFVNLLLPECLQVFNIIYNENETPWKGKGTEIFEIKYKQEWRRRKVEKIRLEMEKLHSKAKRIVPSMPKLDIKMVRAG